MGFFFMLSFSFQRSAFTTRTAGFDHTGEMHMSTAEIYPAMVKNLPVTLGPGEKRGKNVRRAGRTKREKEKKGGKEERGMEKQDIKKEKYLRRMEHESQKRKRG